MSPFGIERVVFANSILYIVGSVLSGLVILVIMVLTTSTTLTIPLGVIPLAALTVTPVIGIGLALGGLALIYKKIGAVSGLMQLFLIGFVALPLDAHPLIAAVPLTVGTTLLETTMRAGTVTVIDPILFAVLVAKAFVYLILGFGALHTLQQMARRRGVLGHY